MSTRCFEIKVMLFIALFFVYGFSMTQAQTDVTGYETVTVSIPATGYDPDAGGTDKGKPQMARVKYNKTFPLVITSDDMGKTELTNNWAEVNGYPNVSDNVDLGIQPGGSKLLAAPYKKYYTQHESQDVADYEPMTYTDNVGKTQRYRMTSAIMPYLLKSDGSSDYSHIDANDAKLMLRTGFSFAQHDVNDISSVSAISSAMTTNNTTWTNAVGIGLKVMVEPNGNHKYLDAGRQNDGICWNIFQNPNSEYLGNSKTLTSWTNSRTDWSASGIQNMPTTFSSKPTGGYARTFFQGNESAWKAAVDAADGTRMIIGGTHGLGDEIKQHLRTAANVKDNAWVASADEVWEYYHIYNKVKIENVRYNDNQLTFDVQVPTYQKNQYRELTLNIPGLTGGQAPTFTSTIKPVTGGYNADGGTGIGYTMNIGLENSIKTHINELMTIYRDDQMNEFVKRDLQYLIDQLWDNNDYVASLNDLPDHHYTIGSTLDGAAGPTIATIKTDADEAKLYAKPRYIAAEGKLYETAAEASGPKYVGTTATTTVDYTEKAVTGTVVLYAEGEDLSGTAVVGCDFDNTNNSDGRYYAMKTSSMGMGGCIVSGTPATVTNSLPRGKYKMVIGYGNSSTGDTNYNVCVGGSSVYAISTSTANEQTVTEFTTDEFDITVDNTPVTITSDYTNDHPEKGNRWIDYVYIIKTADLAAAVPTMTFTKSTAAATVKTGTTATLTATAVPNGGSGLTTAIYAADSEGTPTGAALATGTTSVTYAFTPTADGTSYFVARSTNSAGTTTSELITLTATSITNYTLNIVDKSGNIAMSATIANPGTAQTDPLPDAYRSPFAENYHYYLSDTDAQNNNTGNALASTDDWIQSTVYVGYDVDATKMAANKAYAIIASNRNIYMHVNFRVNESHSDNRFWTVHQQWDVSNGNGTKLNATNLPFIDDNYLWQLGDDPYNIQIKNLKTGRYSEPVSTGSQGNLNTTATASYCLLYWNAETAGSNYTLRYREANPSVTPYYVAYTTYNDGDWRVCTSANEPDAKLTLLYDATLPDLNIKVQQTGSNDVEATLKLHYVSTAKMSDFSKKLPYFLRRAYTKDAFAFYYDAAGEHAITTNATFDTNYFDGSNIYLRYTPVDDWNTDNLFRVSTAEQKNWYALLYNHNTEESQQYLYLDTSENKVKGQAKSSSSASDANFNWALVGSPYALRLINSAAADNVIGLPQSTTDNTYAQPYTEGSEGIITDWEMVVIANNNSNSYPSIRPQGSFSQSGMPNFYLAANGGNQSLLAKYSRDNCQVKAYEKAINVSYHIKDNASGQVVDFTVEMVAGSSIGTLPTSLVRRGTKNLILHSDSYKGDAIAADATATASLTDIYVTYDIDYTDNTDNNQLGVADMFSTRENPKWFTIKSGTQQLYYSGDNLSSVQNNRNGEAESDMWAFIGTPYRFEIINRAAGTSLHAATSSTDMSSWVYITDNTEDYPNYYWETIDTNNAPYLAFRMQETIYGLSFAQTFNENHGVISKNTYDVYLSALTITPVSEMTFRIYGPDNTLSASYDIPIATYSGQGFAADGTSDLSKLLLRRFAQVTAISTNADFSSPLSSYTVSAESINQTVYVKWQYTDDAPVFSTGNEPRDYQYYMINVSNGTNYYMMDVTGNSTDGYTLKPNSSYTTLKEAHKQFALVGTPYAFTLYSRFADANLKTNSSGARLTFLDALDEVATTEAVFDLPIPVNTSITRSTQMDVRMKAHPDKHIWGTASEFWMQPTTGGFAQLMYMVVPVRVFKEGSTALANIVDYQEYALELNPSGTARSTDARLTDSDLYRSTETGSPNYHTKDFRHAFCNYTFYHTYDWATGALSNAIPSTGTYAGLPYYGGSSDQFARAFFATYTVDEDQFSTIYVLDNANSESLKFFGSNAKTASGDNVYYTLKCEVTTLGGARNDNTKAYRWQLTGDPYNLQLTCLGTGDGYQDIPLGVKNFSTTNAIPTVAAGTLARLTNDVTYAAKTHWEVVLNSTGNHVFFLTDDVTTYDDADRYTYSLGQQTYTSANLFASSDKLYVLHLTPAVPQYNVIWNIMEGSSGSYTSVATYTKENVSQGTTITLADMPEVLKRHFCEYNNMYSDATCATAYTNNEATVGDEALNIYVPYTLAAGAPTFYESVAAYDAAGENKDPYLIRLYQNKYVKENDTPDADITDVKNTAAGNSVGKWVLIGSPYKVQLYNVAKENYLYINMGSIAPNASVPVGTADAGNSYWTLLDDKNGDKSAICMWESDNHQMLYLGYNETDVVMNILSDKAQATSAEFVGENGLDGVKMRLHYGDGTLRKNSSNTAMAGQTETFDVYNYFNKGTKLINVMPAKIKRAFCNYTFKYNNEDVTEQDVRDIITNALVNEAKASSELITVDVYYTVNSPFAWSGATTGTGGYADKHWYYLVNNHVPYGSGENGKMYYRDSSPKLRVSEALVQNKLYLNNYEWCVIGDPYGFKMLNHYDPDRKFSEYIRVMDYTDNHNDGLQLEQNDDNDNQNIFEMMPGTYSYNFWMHPVYSSTQLAEYAADSYSFVSQNYNGSAAIIPTGKKTMAYLKTNSSANLRLEILSDATLAEYVKYAGFVGALKYDVANSDALEVGGKTVNVADIKANVLDGSATDADKTMLHNIINDPANIEQMVQGYYRIVPFTQEGGSEHNYIRGYIDEDEKNNSGSMNSNLKVENQTTAEYDPASIFWFDYTTSDGTANGYPRYYVRTQGLSMNGNVLGANDAAYKCRYEDLGAAITQLKISDTASSAYLSCTSGATETNANQCFDEQAGNYKTRLYLQKVNNTNENEMAFKQSLNKGHNGRPLVAGNEAYGNLPYTYASLYVPFDLQVSSGLDDEGNILTPAQCDLIPFIGIRENYHPSGSQSADTYYEQGEYALICQSIDEHQKVVDWVGSNLYIPAATPVINRSRSGMTEVTYVIPTTTPSTDNESLQVKENCLKGTYVEKYDNDTQIRVFGKESVKINGTKTYTGRVGLFQRSNPESTLTHNKPYYVENVHSSATPSTSASRGVMFTFEQSDLTTGISDSSTWSNQGDDALYDMQGRKLSRATKAGVYIMNGRKIVIKK